MFFKENVQYRFIDNARVIDFKEQATINIAIADFIEEQGGVFKVKLNEGGNVGLISFDDANWFSRIEAIPSYSKQNHGSEWFYDGADDEFACFEEVPVEPEAKDRVVLVKTPEETWFAGGNNPTFFTLEDAKEAAKTIIAARGGDTTVTIFCVETTAKAVTEIKFS